MEYKNLRELYAEIVRGLTATLTYKPKGDVIDISFDRNISWIGLSRSELQEIHNIVRNLWTNEDRGGDLLAQTAVVNYLQTSIGSKVIDFVQHYRDCVTLPKIIVSILIQNYRDYPHTSFALSWQEDRPTDVSDWLRYIKTSNCGHVYSTSSVPFFTVSSTNNFDLDFSLSKISEIAWDERVVFPGWDQTYPFGVLHLWDHYNYPHLHMIRGYNQYKYLMLSAVQRTWIAWLNYVRKDLNDHSRITYGFTNKFRQFPMTQAQRREILEIHVATVYVPKKNLHQIRQMSLDEVHSLIKEIISPLSLRGFSLNQILVSKDQLEAELLLGNTPINDRYMVVPSGTIEDRVRSLDRYVTSDLPFGDPVDMPFFTQYSAFYATLNNRLDPSRHSIRYYLFGSEVLNDGLFPNFDHSTDDYGPLLSRIGSKQISALGSSDLAYSYANDGIAISADYHIAIVLRYLLNDSRILTKFPPLAEIQNPTVFPIMKMASDRYPTDFVISTNLLQIFFDYLRYTGATPASLRMALTNAVDKPDIAIKLLNFNDVQVNLLSTRLTGSGEDTNVASSAFNGSDLIFLRLSPQDFVEKYDQLTLLRNSMKWGVLYSFEFIDYSLTRLLAVRTWLLAAMRHLFNSTMVRISLPVLSNGLSVGVRFSFCYSANDVHGFGNVDLAALEDGDFIPFTTQSHFDVIINNLLEPEYVNISKPLSSFAGFSIPPIGSGLYFTVPAEHLNSAVGVVASLCRTATVNGYCDSSDRDSPFFDVMGIIDESRVAMAYRRGIFLQDTRVLSSDLILKPYQPLPAPKLKLTPEQLITHTDKLLLLYLRKRLNRMAIDLSEYGSGLTANVALTTGNFTSYDRNFIELRNVPGVQHLTANLEWGLPLPYLPNNDVLLYDSIFFSSTFIPGGTNMADSIIAMLASVLDAGMLMFNVPVISLAHAQALEDQSRVTIHENRPYLRLHDYPEVATLLPAEFDQLRTYLAARGFTVTVIVPTLLDYIYSSIRLNRLAIASVYAESLLLHDILTLVVCTKPVA